MAEEAPETRAGEPRPSSEPARQTEGLYTGAVPVVRLNGSAGPQKALRALPADLLEALVVLTTLDEELPTLQRALGGDQELVHVDRLHDEVVGAELQAHDMVLHVHPADDDDGRVRVLLADLLEELDARAGHALTATHHRYIELGDDQRRSRPAEHLEPFAPVAGQQARVASSEEELAEEEADVGVVLDDQDLALRHVSPPPPTGRSWRGAYPPKVSLCKVRWTLRKALDSGKRVVHPAALGSAR